jgi:hypothetical protein
VKSIRRYGALEALHVCLWAAALGVGACGGPSEPVRSPAPAKVAWDKSEGASESATEGSSSADEAAAEEDAPAGESATESGNEPGNGHGEVIDLDAPPAKPAQPAKPAHSEAKVAAAAVAAKAPITENEPAEEAPSAAPAARAEPESPASDPLAAELRKRRAQARARTEAKRESKSDSATTKKVAAAAPAKPDYGGSDPCRATSFSVARVRDACASGGRTGAKRVMKEAIGKATATGQMLKCSNCHANQSDYTLKSNAAADLERWLGD